jgi:uncharacterized protein (TIGR02099 family)
MKRLARAIEFFAWALVFAAAAVVLAVRFWLLPDVERYRERIVGVLSTTIGQPVRIGGIEARWFGLNPHIRLRDVRIYDQAGREALALPAIENDLAWSSLLRGEVKLRSLTIDGLRVQVRRDAHGEIHIAGMKASGGDPRFSRWLLAQDEIVLRNAELEWHDERRGAPPLALSAVNLRLRNAGGAHSIGLTAQPPAALGTAFELRMLVEGNTIADAAAWAGRVYAEVGHIDVAAWRAWLDYPFELERGIGALRAWLTLQQGTVREATVDFALSGASARFGTDLPPLRVSSAQGRIRGSVENGGYRVAAQELAVRLDGAGAIGPGDFALAWRGAPDAGGTLLASAVDVEALSEIAASIPLPPEARQRLAEAKPRGRLEEARLEWRGEPTAPKIHAARAKFIDLGAAPSGALPGFSRITGSFDADQASARVVLATRQGEIKLPRVFPEPRVPLDFLNGLVEWERHGDSGFSLRFSSLTFSNAHVSGNAHGTYTSASSGPGSIDLSAQLNRADASELERYLPHASLMGGEAPRAWLTRSVLAGYSGDVRVRIRGDLREFPFVDPSRGQFSVSARLERAVLHYAEGWPRIDNIQGELLFDRDRMRVVARSATSAGVVLANVEAEIANLAQFNRELHLSGEAHGATAQFLSFIQASPVRRMTAGFTDPMSASGNGRLRLKLELPLKEPARTRVAGAYEFAGNNVVVNAQLPPIEGATGKVSFTESTLTVSDVEGRLFGGPVAISGATQSDGSMQIIAKGEATLAGTRSVFDHPWRRYLTGQASYVATVSTAKGRTHLLVRSPLLGVASALPAPLAKSAGEALPLQLEFTADDRLKVRLGRIVAAELVRRRQGDVLMVQRAGVALMPAADIALRLPDRAGTLVYGSLAALDVDKWLPLFAGEQAGFNAASFDLKLGALDLYGKRLNHVSLRGAAEPAGWSANLASDELAGDLSYRSEGGGRLVARLTRFRTPDDYPGAQDRGSLQPSELPTMDLVAERFAWRGKELGRIEIQGERAGTDWRIGKVAIANADATLAGTGVWRGGTPSRSHVDFELSAADSGRFLARIGYPDLVSGAKARFKGRLAWDGNPAVIDYASLSGAVQLDADNGRFLEIEPGLGKLISLMSLQSLPRRIALDFRDVFSKGFDFERISSSGEIQSGIMAVKDFRMRGSSAQVEMSGEVDLVQETQNMRVRVIPSLGDSAATVIGLVNPLLAIPAAIAQKILKDPLGHIFAYNYAVSGGWSDPKVTKLGIEAQQVDPKGSPQ